MKRKILSVIIILIILTACLMACEEQAPVDKGYVVITFVTGTELVIDPITLDGTEDKYMPEDPVRAGYTFAGWYHYVGSNFVLFTTENAITEDITLYAKWVENKFEPTPPDIPTVEDDKGIKYEMKVDSYTVVGYTGDKNEITIPERYAGYPVDEIGSYAFADTDLVKVTFGKSVVKVAEYAFRGADSLAEIVVKENGYYASDEGVLTNKEGTAVICVPKGADIAEYVVDKEEIIYPYAFEDCTFSITFDGEYKYVENLAFAGFDGEITLSNKIVEIRKDAFYDATAVVNFGENVTALRNGAFAGYRGTRLMIPSCVTTIELQAFENCTAVVDLSSTTLSSIGEKAFAGYKGATLVIPSTVSSIGKNAFYGAQTVVTFEENSLYRVVEELSFASFGGSGNAEGEYMGTVTFPESVVKVEKNAFYGSYSNVYFYNEEGQITLDEGAFSQFKGKKVFNKNS